MNLLLALAIAIIMVSCYACGWEDGRDEERESTQWKRMDELLGTLARKRR